MRDTGEDGAFMKLDAFVDNLLDEHRAQESSATAEANYVGKSKQRTNSNSSKNNQKKFKCGRCKSNTHNNACWHQHPEKAPEGWIPRNNSDKQTPNKEKATPHRAFTSKVADTVSEKLATALLSQNNDRWIFDSGASSHMTHPLELLDNYRTTDSIARIGKGCIKAYSIGSVTFKVMTSEGSGIVTSNDVLYVQSW
jgi:hypothetical protein